MSYISQTGGALANLRDGRTGFMGQLDTVAGELAADSVGTVQIQDGAVTNAKLAANAVTTDKILDGTIAAADLAATGVGAATYGDGTGFGLGFTVNAQGQITGATSVPMGEQRAVRATVTSPIASGTQVAWTGGFAVGSIVSNLNATTIQVDNSAGANPRVVGITFNLYGTGGAGNAATFTLSRVDLGSVLDAHYTSIDPANCSFKLQAFDTVAAGVTATYYVTCVTNGAGAFTAPGTAGDHFRVDLIR